MPLEKHDFNVGIDKTQKIIGLKIEWGEYWVGKVKKLGNLWGVMNKLG